MWGYAEIFQLNSQVDLSYTVNENLEELGSCVFLKWDSSTMSIHDTEHETLFKHLRFRSRMLNLIMFMCLLVANFKMKLLEF